MDESDSEFPGQHFQGDLLLLALGSSQKDLFQDDWLDVMVRVYWLKARFQALQVQPLLARVLLVRAECGQTLKPPVLSGRHGVGLGEL